MPANTSKTDKNFSSCTFYLTCDQFGLQFEFVLDTLLFLVTYKYIKTEYQKEEQAERQAEGAASELPDHRAPYRKAQYDRSEHHHADGITYPPDEPTEPEVMRRNRVRHPHTGNADGRVHQTAQRPSQQYEYDHIPFPVESKREARKAEDQISAKHALERGAGADYRC